MVLAAAIAAYAAIISGKREMSIKDLTSQKKLAQAEADRKELEREIARLKTIKWWQFWRK